MPRRDATSAAVRLGEVVVGRLRHDPSRQAVAFQPTDVLADPAGAVLGQRFLDDPRQPSSAHARLPAWFSNLLPEGLLRDLVRLRRRRGGLAADG